MKGFVDKIGDFIERNGLMDHQGVYLVALSGGPDSVCMLLVLQRLGYRLEAIHCNFHLRGEESDRDELFCETLCKQLDIPFHRVHFDTRSFAELHHISIEMAARELRYNYFHQLLQVIGAKGVCVAHHKDDVVETMLINLIRGTGLRGLTGIPPRSRKNPEVLRPMLCVSRDEIMSFLHDLGQDFIIDSSNLKDDVLRNKLRLNVIPLLEAISPAATTNMALTAERLMSAEKLFSEALDKHCETAIAEKNDHFIAFHIKELTSNEYVLFESLHPYHFTSAQCESLFRQLSNHNIDDGSQTYTSSTHTAATHGDLLIVFANDDPRLAEHLTPRQIPTEGRYDLGAMGRYEIRIVQKTADFIVDKSQDIACLDADKAAFPLTLRPVATGDRFNPYGMKGSKLVSDFLTDKKRSPYEKRCQLVLACTQGEESSVIWLVNERTDGRFAVTDRTKHVLVIKKLEQKPN